MTNYDNLSLRGSQEPWTMLELDNGLILVKVGRQILMINEMSIEYDEYK